LRTYVLATYFVTVLRHYQPNAAFSFAAKVLREILIP
jgi:hypothetical protein